MKRVEKFKKKHLEAQTFNEMSKRVDKEDVEIQKQNQILNEIDAKFFKENNKKTKNMFINVSTKPFPKQYQQKKKSNKEIMINLKNEVLNHNIDSFFNKEIIYSQNLENNLKSLNNLKQEFNQKLEIAENSFNKLLSLAKNQKIKIGKDRAKFLKNIKEFDKKEISLFNKSLGFKTYQIHTTTLTDEFAKLKNDDENIGKSLTVIIMFGSSLVILFFLIVYFGGF